MDLMAFTGQLTPIEQPGHDDAPTRTAGYRRNHGHRALAGRATRRPTLKRMHLSVADRHRAQCHFR